jgi:hypothetical protein
MVMSDEASGSTRKAATSMIMVNINIKYLIRGKGRNTRSNRDSTQYDSGLICDTCTVPSTPYSVLCSLYSVRYCDATKIGSESCGTGPASSSSKQRTVNSRNKYICWLLRIFQRQTNYALLNRCSSHGEIIPLLARRYIEISLLLVLLLLLLLPQTKKNTETKR